MKNIVGKIDFSINIKLNKLNGNSLAMELIPGTEKIEFKEKFVERYSKLTNWEEFRRASLSFLERAVRVNTLKGTVSGVKKSIEGKGWELKQIPWCKEGFWIEGPVRDLEEGSPTHLPPPTAEEEEGKEERERRREEKGTIGEGITERRRDVGNLLEHHLGKIYVQEAASMIPPIVLGAKQGELVLDMCAAPGSKTTQIAAMMKNKGLLIANDVSGERLQALGINLQRCGVLNALITLMRGQGFRGMEFDRILVDAPCSATGTIMRSLRTIKMWNPGMIRHLASVQRKLLEKAFGNLRKGGMLVYSTCTLEPEEDEGVVSWLLEKEPEAKLEEIKEEELPGLKRSAAVLEFGGEEFNPEVRKCLRIWPQDNGTEGFFVARIRKV